MPFYALTTRSYPVRLASKDDPAIDWQSTAVEMGIDPVDEVAARRKYHDELDAFSLRAKDGMEISWFEVRAISDRDRLDQRTEAVAFGARRYDLTGSASAEKLKLWAYGKAVKAPAGVGFTDDIRAELGEFALRLSMSSISQEHEDDVGKSCAP